MNVKLYNIEMSRWIARWSYKYGYKTVIDGHTSMGTRTPDGHTIMGTICIPTNQPVSRVYSWDWVGRRAARSIHRS